MSEQVFAPADALDLLGVARLTGVQAYEVRGRRTDPLPPEDVVKSAAPEVAIRVSDTSIEVRMKLEVATEEAKLFADMAVSYTLSKPCHVTLGVLEEFVDRVGVMALYPFVRESIFSTAARLRVKAPVLGLLLADAFHVGLLEMASDTTTPVRLARELGVSPSAVRAWLRESGLASSPSGRWVISAGVAATVRDHFA